jgi:hypothetical protein
MSRSSCEQFRYLHLVIGARLILLRWPSIQGALMENRRCLACGQLFRPRPQAPAQRFCTAPGCQQERRRRWQVRKLTMDPDYRENQNRAQRSWCKRNPDYWREYREAHPEYQADNRLKQTTRNQRRTKHSNAKMDASMPGFPVPTGTYRLSPLVGGVVAKMGACTVQITLLSGR